MGQLLAQQDRPFPHQPVIRNIVAQPKSSVDIRQLMEEGKVLLVNLSKGKLGEDNSSLLGTILVGKILISALSRSELEQSCRRQFHLIVDEYHSFATESFPTLQSEARKFAIDPDLGVIVHDDLEDHRRAGGIERSEPIGDGDAGPVPAEAQPAVALARLELAGGQNLPGGVIEASAPGVGLDVVGPVRRTRGSQVGPCSPVRDLDQGDVPIAPPALDEPEAIVSGEIDDRRRRSGWRISRRLRGRLDAGGQDDGAEHAAGEGQGAHGLHRTFTT